MLGESFDGFIDLAKELDEIAKDCSEEKRTRKGQ